MGASTPKLPLELKWTFEGFKYLFSGCNWSPAVADGRVFFSSVLLYALDSNSGAKLWEFEFPADWGVASGPTVSGDRAFAGSEDGKFYAIDARTGRKLWEFQTDGKRVGSQVVADRYVFALSDEGVYALDVATGKKQWKSALGQVHAAAWPAFADGRVFVGSQDGNFQALDAQTGNRVWSFQVGRHLSSSPVVSRGRVLIGSEDGGLFCLDAATGAQVWQLSDAKIVTTSLAVADGRVLYTPEDMTFNAVDESTGRNLWKIDFSDPFAGAPSPAVASGVVFFANEHGFHGIDSGNGLSLWEFQHKQSQNYHSPAATDGRVLFVSGDGGTLYAFGPP